MRPAQDQVSREARHKRTSQDAELHLERPFQPVQGDVAGDASGVPGVRRIGMTRAKITAKAIAHSP